MVDYYNLLGAAQKAPRATARAPKSSLKSSRVAAAEIADGAGSVDSSWKESRLILRAFAQKDEILIMNSTEDKVFLEATVSQLACIIVRSWVGGPYIAVAPKTY